MKTVKIDARLLFNMFAHSTIKLAENKEKVDALNVFPVPDGDTGTNMSLTMSQALEEISKLNDPDLPTLVKSISKGCLIGARGNSGVILSQIFRGFANALADKNSISVKEFADALLMSSVTAYKAVLKPVEGTILTVIREVAESAEKIAKETNDFNIFFEKIVEAGKISLENTPNLLEPLKEAGVVDSGGMGLLVIISGFYEALQGVNVDLSNFESGNKLPSEIPVQSHIDPENITFTYCTEFIIQGDRVEECDLKPFILDIGDSVVYVPDGDILKVHVHTDKPGEVLTKALEYGHIIKTKIENMRLQHSEILARSEGASPAPKESKKNAFLAVCSGVGISDILSSMGIDALIEGGQTMNPSTNDFLEAIETINAENIFIFPNNSNIILAANQAAELSDKHILVVPTKTVPQCITAMFSYDEEAEAEENLQTFREEIQKVKTLQITHAVRDTQIGSLEIKEGDYLGIADGEIIYSDTGIGETILESLQKIVDEDAELISIYVGQDIQEDDAEAILEKIEEAFDQCDVEMRRGEQPVYYYIISVE
ncbi:MAG: DAK2 domain-containing protein [Bacillota bacterium]|nr:DAK2 domain-containing protein [Bacillota bacterium]